MLRIFTAPFYARGDTLTPVLAALLAAAVNVALKIVLMKPLAQVGLAFATSIGAWINLTLLWLLARRQGFAVSGAGLKPVIRLFIAGAILAISLFLGERALRQALTGVHFQDEITLAILVVVGAIIYGLAVLLLLGRGWLTGLMKEVSTAADTPEPPLPPDPTAASRALPDNTPPPNS